MRTAKHMKYKMQVNREIREIREKNADAKECEFVLLARRPICRAALAKVRTDFN